MTREIEYLKRLNRALVDENKVLQEQLILSNSAVETLFSYSKEN
tara:strand:+ start:558 stop:689 length:132 start_codon:yes stop_codon:yes gene_type:complete